MDNDTSFNGRGHIPSEISIINKIIDVGGVNSEVALEEVEEEDKYHQHHLAEKNNKLLLKQQKKLVGKQYQQHLVDKQ